MATGEAHGLGQQRRPDPEVGGRAALCAPEGRATVLRASGSQGIAETEAGEAVGWAVARRPKTRGAARSPHILVCPPPQLGGP